MSFRSAVLRMKNSTLNANVRVYLALSHAISNASSECVSYAKCKINHCSSWAKSLSFSKRFVGARFPVASLSPSQ
jgi:hypothetical protein